MTFSKAKRVKLSVQCRVEQDFKPGTRSQQESTDPKHTILW